MTKNYNNCIYEQNGIYFCVNPYSAMPEDCPCGGDKSKCPFIKTSLSSSTLLLLNTLSDIFDSGEI